MGQAGQAAQAAKAARTGGEPVDSGRLVLVLGDQLDEAAPVLRGLTAADTVLMMEVASESTHVPSHVQRTVLFLSAMRHFAARLGERGLRVRYIRLDDPGNTQSFAGEVERAAAELSPGEIVCTLPGEWRVLQELQACADRLGAPLRILPDEHFLSTPERFAAWAEGRRSLTMEYFYREQRRATGYLMDGGSPEGGEWNFDKENRLPFGREGPQPPPRAPVRFEPDAITREVMAAVAGKLPGLPGRIGGSGSAGRDFGWPVTRGQALEALDDFVRHRLALFGPFEDAMWAGAPVLHHSTLSPALNLKLISPRECCDAAERAYRAGKVPLQSAEAFIRQIIGWREFIRGVYWLEGPGYGDRNGLEEHGKLPEFYWTGETDMACLRACVGQVLESGYGHHIQRLMVTGNFALLAGIDPAAVNAWYLAVYADAYEWVELPNTHGMALHADGGLMASKPYAASGAYINRMSDYCRGCAFDVKAATGERACPFNYLYWDFVARHAQRFAGNPRMAMPLRTLERMDPARVAAMRAEAKAFLDGEGMAAGWG